MNKSMGQEAYEATQQYLASNGASGDVPPEVDMSWEALPAVYREAWEVGAQAALAEHVRLHHNGNPASGRPQLALDLPLKIEREGE